MKILKQFPIKHNCPVCNTNDNKSCCFVAVEGKAGVTTKSEPVHIDCLNLTYAPRDAMIFQQLEIKIYPAQKKKLNVGGKIPKHKHDYESINATEIVNGKKRTVQLCKICRKVKD